MFSRTGFSQARDQPIVQGNVPEETDPSMASPRDPTIIKKYANRRLYHTGTSSYVTLDDLCQMVRAGEDFVVLDAKTGEDLTRSVLAQIIFEEEAKAGQSLLPTTFLRQLIRFYGDSMQAVVPRFLEMSIDTLTQEQQKLREQFSKALSQTPFGDNPLSQAAIQAMEEQARANMAMFRDAMKIFNPFAASQETPAAADAEAAPATEPEEGATDLDALKRQVAEMQARLEKLSR